MIFETEPIPMTVNLTRRVERRILTVGVIVWLIFTWWAHDRFLPYDVKNTDVGTVRFQAETFASGRIYRETPEPREFFQQWQAMVRDRSYAYYPPGHALLLALPLVVGLDPWWIVWLMSGISILAIYGWIRRCAGVLSAILALVIFLCSPLLAANSTTLLSHSSSILATSLFLWWMKIWEQDGRRFAAFGAGFVLAYLWGTRPLNAVALGAAWIFWSIFRNKIETAWGKPADRRVAGLDWKGWVLFILGGLVVLVPLLLYYRELGGRWCLDLFSDYWPRNRYGFGQNLGRGEPGHYFQTFTDHGFREMMENWGFVVVQLLGWWVGHGGVGGVVVGVAGAGGVWLARQWWFEGRLRDKLLAGSFVVPVLIWMGLHGFLYSLYFTSSVRGTGPRYVSEWVPGLALLTVLPVAFLRSRRSLWMMFASLYVIILVGSVVKKVQFYEEHRSGVVAQRNLEETVLRGAEAPALVLIRSFWIGHPFPIFLNPPDMKGPLLFGCDRGEEDRKLAERFPDRNIYVLKVGFPSGKPQVELVKCYDGKSWIWLMAPEEIEAPFYLGSKFSKPIRLQGDVHRLLFYPKPDEIEPQ